MFIKLCKLKNTKYDDDEKKKLEHQQRLDNKVFLTVQHSKRFRDSIFFSFFANIENRKESRRRKINLMIYEDYYLQSL